MSLRISGMLFQDNAFTIDTCFRLMFLLALHGLTTHLRFDS